MATRRAHYATSDPLAVNMRQPKESTAPAPSNTSPAVPISVVAKLLLFTFLMVTAPISTYFFVARVWNNNTYGGVAAAVVANAVLLGYILVAVWEDQGEDNASEKKRGKAE